MARSSPDLMLNGRVESTIRCGHQGFGSSCDGIGRMPTVASFSITARRTEWDDWRALIGVWEPYWSRAKSQYPGSSDGE